MNILVNSAFVFISLVLIGLAIYAIFIFMKLKKEKHRTDYFALFMFGIIWIAVCLVMQKWVLSILGVIFAIVGLSKKQSWNKNKMNWSTMKPIERADNIMLLLILLAVLIIAGSIWWISVQLIA